MGLIVIPSYPQSGMNALHIVIALNYFTFVCNLISVLVEMINFAMVKVDSFGKERIDCRVVQIYDGKDARIVVSKSQQ